MADNQIWKYISIVLTLLLALSIVSGALIYINIPLKTSNPSSSNITTNEDTVNQYKQKINKLNAEIAAQNQTIDQLEQLIKERDSSHSSLGNETIKVLRISGGIDASLVGPTLMKLRNWRRNDNVTAVLLWIDSPGGGVGSTRQIYDAVKKLSLVKPVIAYTGGYMLSGGYYLAQGADKIISRPKATIGSIGVLYVHYNYKENLEDNKIEVTVFKTGKYKDTGAPWRALTEEEKNNIDASINDSFNDFVNVIAQNTDLNSSRVLRFADGSTYYGNTAKRYGLIDDTAKFEGVIRKLEDQADISSSKIDYVSIGDKELSSTGSDLRGLVYLDPKYLDRGD